MESIITWTFLYVAVFSTSGCDLTNQSFSQADNFQGGAGLLRNWSVFLFETPFLENLPINSK